jgi:hypothetical protein
MGLLRGYGNAIVPQVAEVFVRAWIEARREMSSQATESTDFSAGPLDKSQVATYRTTSAQRGQGADHG